MAQSVPVEYAKDALHQSQTSIHSHEWREEGRGRQNRAMTGSWRNGGSDLGGGRSGSGSAFWILTLFPGLIHPPRSMWTCTIYRGGADLHWPTGTSRGPLRAWSADMGQCGGWGLQGNLPSARSPTGCSIACTSTTSMLQGNGGRHVSGFSFTDQQSMYTVQGLYCARIVALL